MSVYLVAKQYTIYYTKNEANIVNISFTFLGPYNMFFWEESIKNNVEFQYHNYHSH
jgi:hypothetical protein